MAEENKEENKKFKIIMFAPTKPEIYDKVKEHYEKSEEYQLVDVENSSEAHKVIEEQSTAIILFSISNKQEIINLVTLCKSNALLIKEGLLKISGFNLTPSKKVEAILNKCGISDLFNETITTKTLDYKINFWKRGITRTYTNVMKIQSKREALGLEPTVDDSEDKMSAGKRRSSRTYQLIPPLRFSSDCWVMSKEGMPRFIMGHWIFEVYGPGPYAGRWSESKNPNDPDNQYWKWIPSHEDQFMFIEHPGSWFFKGKQPQFMWKTNTWKFMAESPMLYFQETGGENHYRINDKDGEVLVCKDSRFALSKKELLIESADPKIVQKSTKVDEEAEEVEGEVQSKSADQYSKYYKGDVQDEETISFRNKTEREEDEIHLDNRMVAKNVEEDDLGNYYQRKKSNEEIEIDLERDKNKHEGRADELSGFWGAKKPKEEQEVEEIEKPDAPQKLEPTIDTSDGFYSNKVQKKEQEDVEDEQSQKDKVHLEQTIDMGQGGLFNNKLNSNEEEIITREAKQKEKVDELSGFWGKKKLGQEQVDEEEIDKELQMLKSGEEIEGFWGSKKDKKEETEEEIIEEEMKTAKPEEENIEGFWGAKKNKQEEIDEDLIDQELQLLQETEDLGGYLKGDVSKEEEETEEELDEVEELESYSEEIKGHYNSRLTQEDVDEDDKNKGVLEMEVEDIEGNMSGEIGEQEEYDNDPYSGEGSTDVLDEDPYAGDVDGTDQLDGQLRGNTNWHEGDLGGYISFAKLEIKLVMSAPNSPALIKTNAVPIELNDIIDKTLVVNVPIGNEYQEGQDVRVWVNCSYSAARLEFNVTGKVTELNPFDENLNVCNIELVQYNWAVLKQLQSLFAERQKNILNFFKASKGF